MHICTQICTQIWTQICTQKYTLIWTHIAVSVGLQREYDDEAFGSKEKRSQSFVDKELPHCCTASCETVIAVVPLNPKVNVCTVSFGSGCTGLRGHTWICTRSIWRMVSGFACMENAIDGICAFMETLGKLGVGVDEVRVRVRVLMLVLAWLEMRLSFQEHTVRWIPKWSSSRQHAITGDIVTLTAMREVAGWAGVAGRVAVDEAEERRADNEHEEREAMDGLT